MYVTSYRTRRPIFGDGSNVSPIGEYWTNRPSLVIDGRRVVVCYNKYSDYKLSIRWWSDSVMVSSCAYAYNPHVLVKSPNLILAWFTTTNNWGIKYSKCQRTSNGYAQPSPESVFAVVTGGFPLITAPRIIDDNLLIFHDDLGVYYSLRQNNIWNTTQIWGQGHTCPQSFIFFGHFSLNPILKTYWSNGDNNNRHYLISKSINLPSQGQEARGSGTQTAEIEQLPMVTMLHTPKPNPFTNLTQIRFQIPIESKVELKVYNSAGKLVNALVDDAINPGYYTMVWNGKDNQERICANGIYFVRLKTKDYDVVNKMIMVK